MLDTNKVKPAKKALHKTGPISVFKICVVLLLKKVQTWFLFVWGGWQGVQNII